MAWVSFGGKLTGETRVSVINHMLAKSRLFFGYSFVADNMDLTATSYGVIMARIVTEFGEIMQNNGHNYVVKGHFKVTTSVPI